MATQDNSSPNAREWFEDKPEVIPGQMSFETDALLGTAGAEPVSPPQGTADGTGQQTKPQRRRRRGKSKAPERPASLQRPPARPLTVAEVVAKRLEANREQGQDQSPRI